MIILLDHQDSFVHLLAGRLARLGAQTRVIADDSLSLEELDALTPDGIVLSPGPRIPEECHLAIATVQQLGRKTPILGVCLGHQVIVTALGGRVSRAAHPRHGMTSAITHDGLGVYAGLPQPFRATRYHSLAAERNSLPDELPVTSTADDGEVMGVRHREWPVEGVQFHPESVLTDSGSDLLANWLQNSRLR